MTLWSEAERALMAVENDREAREEEERRRNA